MLLLMALGVATVTVVTRGALLHTELKTGKNESVALVDSLRKKLISGNYDYIASDEGYLHKEVPIDNLNARAHNDDEHNEQYKREELRHNKDINRYENDGYRNNKDGQGTKLLEMQRYLPPDIQDDDSVKMRHDDREEPSGNKHDQPRDDKRTALKLENRNDIGQENLDKFRYEKSYKHDYLRQDKHGDVRNEHNARLRYDNSDKVRLSDKDKHLSLRYVKHDQHHINREHDETDKLRYDKHDDLQGDNQRHDKPDKWEHDKGEDLEHDRVDQLEYENRIYFQNNIQGRDERGDKLNEDHTEKRHENRGLRDDEQRIIVQLGDEKRTHFRLINREQNKRDELRRDKHETSGEKRKNFFKLRQDKHDDLRPVAPRYTERENEQPKKLIHGNDKLKPEKFQGEELSYNDHDLYGPDRLRGNDRENFRQVVLKHNKPYKSRFEKRYNARSGELRPDNPQNLRHDTRDKYDDLRHDNEHNMLRNDNHENYRQNNQNKMIPNTRNEHDSFRDDKQRYDKTNKLRHSGRDIFRENDTIDDKTDKLSRGITNHFRKDDDSYDSKKLGYNKPKHLKHIKKKDSNLDDKIEHILHVKSLNKVNYDHEHDASDSDSRHHSFGDKLGSKKKQTKSKHDQPLQYDMVNQNIRNIKQSLNHKHHTSEHKKPLPEDLGYTTLGGKLKQVTMAHDKFEQDLEREILRFHPINDNDKRDRYDNYNDSKYNKEKHNNHKYNNDKYVNDRNNNKYNNKNQQSQPEYRARDTRAKYESETDSTKSVYVPLVYDENNIDTDNDQSVDNDNYDRGNGTKEQQSDIHVSKKDLLYYMDEEKLAQAMDFADTLVNDNAKKYDKKYKILKMPAASRRSGSQRRVVQEEGAMGVALVALDGGELPPFQLPRSRRQYMRVDESNYQLEMSDEMANIPVVHSNDEPKLDGVEIKPPGLTKSPEDAVDYMNTTHTQPQ